MIENRLCVCYIKIVTNLRQIVCRLKLKMVSADEKNKSMCEDLRELFKRWILHLKALLYQLVRSGKERQTSRKGTFGMPDFLHRSHSTDVPLKLEQKLRCIREAYPFMETEQLLSELKRTQYQNIKKPGCVKIYVARRSKRNIKSTASSSTCCCKFGDNFEKNRRRKKANMQKITISKQNIIYSENRRPFTPTNKLQQFLRSRGFVSEKQQELKDVGSNVHQLHKESPHPKVEHGGHAKVAARKQSSLCIRKRSSSSASSRRSLGSDWKRKYLRSTLGCKVKATGSSVKKRPFAQTSTKPETEDNFRELCRVKTEGIKHQEKLSQNMANILDTVLPINPTNTTSILQNYGRKETTFDDKHLQHEIQSTKITCGGESTSKSHVKNKVTNKQQRERQKNVTKSHEEQIFNTNSVGFDTVKPKLTNKMACWNYRTDKECGGVSKLMTCQTNGQVADRNMQVTSEDIRKSDTEHTNIKVTRKLSDYVNQLMTRIWGKCSTLEKQPEAMSSVISIPKHLTSPKICKTCAAKSAIKQKQPAQCKSPTHNSCQKEDRITHHKCGSLNRHRSCKFTSARTIINDKVKTKPNTTIAFLTIEVQHDEHPTTSKQQVTKRAGMNARRQKRSNQLQKVKRPATKCQTTPAKNKCNYTEKSKEHFEDSPKNSDKLSFKDADVAISDKRSKETAEHAIKETHIDNMSIQITNKRCETSERSLEEHKGNVPTEQKKTEQQIENENRCSFAHPAPTEVSEGKKTKLRPNDRKPTEVAACAEPKCISDNEKTEVLHCQNNFAPSVQNEREYVKCVSNHEAKSATNIIQGDRCSLEVQGQRSSKPDISSGKCSSLSDSPGKEKNVSVLFEATVSSDFQSSSQSKEARRNKSKVDLSAPELYRVIEDQRVDQHVPESSCSVGVAKAEHEICAEEQPRNKVKGVKLHGADNNTVSKPNVPQDKSYIARQENLNRTFVQPSAFLPEKYLKNSLKSKKESAQMSTTETNKGSSITRKPHNCVNPNYLVTKICSSKNNTVPVTSANRIVPQNSLESESNQRQRRLRSKLTQRRESNHGTSRRKGDCTTKPKDKSMCSGIRNLESSNRNWRKPAKILQGYETNQVPTNESVVHLLNILTESPSRKKIKYDKDVKREELALKGSQGSISGNDQATNIIALYAEANYDNSKWVPKSKFQSSITRLTDQRKDASLTSTPREQNLIVQLNAKGDASSRVEITENLPMRYKDTHVEQFSIFDEVLSCLSDTPTIDNSSIESDIHEVLLLNETGGHHHLMSGLILFKGFAVVLVLLIISLVIRYLYLQFTKPRRKPHVWDEILSSFDSLFF